MNLTLEELERLAYATGDTKTAVLCAKALDAQEEAQSCGDLDLKNEYWRGYDAGYAAAEEK